MLVRLFDPVMQFQNKGGALNTAGRLEVYLEGTDDLAQIYSDEEGHVPLSQPVILDNNGRSRGLYVESGVKYRLTVRTNHGALLFTVRNMVPVGGGGGGGQSLSASLPLKIEGGTITNNGTGITCTGDYAWAEGHNTTASGEHSHAEGSETIASGANTHAEGAATKATYPHAHAEGFHTEATATSAHAEGSGAKATTTTAHAEGQDTVASGDASHAQGRNSVASGAYSHASGYGTRATGQGSHAVGKYNDDGSALFVVGNGTDNNHRSDVFKVDSNGDTWVMIGGVLTKATNVSGGTEPDDWIDITNEWAFVNDFRLRYQGATPGIGNEMNVLYSPARKIVKFTGSMRINKSSSWNDSSWKQFLQYRGNRFYTSYNAPSFDFAPKVYPRPIGGMSYIPATDSNGTSISALCKLTYTGEPGDAVEICALSMQLFMPTNATIYGGIMEGLQLSVTPIP